ncbi:MAG: sulfur globule protein CV1 [Candidatus Thiosymbion ectosymbiont of Robbea hypermnestra]|nr:sulfur globule protein CV1 [Candidatus Thiosymbion ectosymbiont of Robbea hypermnestra]
MKDPRKLAAAAITAGTVLFAQPAAAFFGMMDDFFGNNDDYYDGYGGPHRYGGGPWGYGGGPYGWGGGPYGWGGGPYGWGAPYGYGAYPGVQVQQAPAPAAPVAPRIPE